MSRPWTQPNQTYIAGSIDVLSSINLHFPSCYRKYYYTYFVFEKIV